jgi:hypothetical protein
MGTPLAHTLVVAPGPRCVDIAEPGWLVSCSACAASVHGVASAGTFARARCPSVPYAVHDRREVLVHELVRVPWGWACLRCRLAVSSALRANAARSKCPVTFFFLMDGSPCMPTGLQVQLNLAALAVWKSSAPSGVLAVVVVPPLIAFSWSPSGSRIGSLKPSCGTPASAEVIPPRLAHAPAFRLPLAKVWLHGPQPVSSPHSWGVLSTWRSHVSPRLGLPERTTWDGTRSFVSRCLFG